jgi:hypothetical protein
MGAQPRESVGRVREAVRTPWSADGDVAEGFRRARGALSEVTRDIQQLRGRAGSLVKKTKPRK